MYYVGWVANFYLSGYLLQPSYALSLRHALSVQSCDRCALFQETKDEIWAQIMDLYWRYVCVCYLHIVAAAASAKVAWQNTVCAM